jgi:hypothetical protein
MGKKNAKEKRNRQGTKLAGATPREIKNETGD